MPPPRVRRVVSPSRAAPGPLAAVVLAWAASSSPARAAPATSVAPAVALVRAAPPEVRAALGGRTARIDRRELDGGLAAWDLFDACERHLATFLGDGPRPDTWLFAVGDERIRLSRPDRHGVPQERRVEHATDGLVDSTRTQRRAGRGWRDVELEDLSTCAARGVLRKVTYDRRGAEVVTWEPCAVS